MYPVDEDAVGAYRRAPPATAASVLLRRQGERSATRVVVEGAPGQGKSTITQYICQVHRLKLLGKLQEVSTLKKVYRYSPVRIPFRIDLRDFAAWLSGRNPFSADPTAHPPTSVSLESFIAAQVTHHSGGQEFSASDLLAVCRTAHISIVLDGFDEVADVPTRRRVVEEITKSAARLEAHGRSIQVIVTSRPAAFANSPGFPLGNWVHLEIQSMTPSQIDEYSKKWMIARNLPSRERSEFAALLAEKLEQPHMRDLARNPMQLTILLALIHTRGLSLPDKRTSLYDNYMELFFNREAEKSRIVREQRDLLIDIHRYLAWVLHSSAESGAGVGSITEADLKAVLVDYLRSEGHSTSLVEELFTGMVERVVALVSRVQGTFEFEVQPLREYFAARHLYETAPYSPPGSERHGTKPEIFDALARNFYWLNVLRFFCGCFSRGELSSLADGIEDLSKSAEYSLVSHPRTLAVMLLRDWVFSQQPLAIKRVVTNIFAQPGFKVFLSTNSQSQNGSAILPDRCGRADFANEALQNLASLASPEDRASLLHMVRENLNPSDRFDRWMQMRPREGTPTRWLADGRRLGIFEIISSKDLDGLVMVYGTQLVEPLARNGRFDFICSNAAMLREALNLVLDGRGIQVDRGKPQEHLTAIERFIAVLSPMHYHNVLIDEQDGFIRHYLGPGPLNRRAHDDKERESVASEDLSLIRKMLSEVDHDPSAESGSWALSLEPWTKLVDSGRSLFGNRWALKALAVLAAGIKSSNDRGVWDDGAWKGDGNLVGHMRYARLRSGNLRWWHEQIALGTHSGEEGMLITLVAAVWATPKTLLNIADGLSAIVDKLSFAEWDVVDTSFLELIWATQGLQSALEPRAAIPTGISDRLKLILGRWGKPLYGRRMALENLSAYSGGDSSVGSFLCEMKVAAAMDGATDWESTLKTLKSEYVKSTTIMRLDTGSIAIPEEVATEICRHAQDYPQAIVRVAEKRLASILGEEAPKLASVANANRWFG